MYVWGTDMWEALQRSEAAKRNGDHSATNLALNSLLHFGLMRFSKCRQSARLTLEVEPNSPIAKELLVLSWLVFFPPFLMAHFLLYMSNFVRRHLERFGELVVLVALAFGGWALSQIAVSIYSVFGELTYTSAILRAGPFVGYMIYVVMFLGSIAKWLMPSSSNSR